MGHIAGARAGHIRDVRHFGGPFFSWARVSAVELGKISPALKTLAHFAKKLEVPLKDLIPD